MSERLSKSDWIRHGLNILANETADALKVGPMADKLGVSRGSFYWHFPNVSEFHSQLVQRWENQATDRVIEDLDARHPESGRLLYLMQRAFTGRPKLDGAMRAWAARNATVAKAVASVDAKRIGKLASLLQDVGVRNPQAAYRATFLYWAFLGQAAIIDPHDASVPESALSDIAELLQSGSNR
jgi:AcrR family transcriptional regulator